MRRFLLPFLCSVFIFSCASNKTHLERIDADTALLNAIEKLPKDNNDDKTLSAVQVLYDQVKLSHLTNIKNYSSKNDINLFDLIIKEYDALQIAYNEILKNSAAFKVINPQSFANELSAIKYTAAEAIYSAAEKYLDKQNRADVMKAFTFFKLTDKYVPGFKQSNIKMQQAYNEAVVIVVINKIEDDSHFLNIDFGNTGHNYSNQYLQENLVKDLRKTAAIKYYAAKFYSDEEAHIQNIQPDWVVGLKLQDINIPEPTTYTSQYQKSARIPNGTDTSGKQTYTTVYATVYRNQQSFNSTAKFEMNINDITNNRTISYKTFSHNYQWEQTSETYIGDIRAVSNNNFGIVNNNNNRIWKGDVLDNLYKHIYPQLKKEIDKQVSW